MNAYCLACQETGLSVLIDPGEDPDELRGLVKGTLPTAILLTHSHYDHVGALAEMGRLLSVPVLAHPGPRAPDSEVELDRALADGEEIVVGRRTLKAVYTPGHTPDQICYRLADDDRIVVGDTIFEGGPGKTWSSADFETTLHTIERIVLSWADETVLYPGHGPSFRLGDIRPRVEAFLAADHGGFYGDAVWEM
jgi:glyoxylase-like metal-dependent hydrolase (beta-lactamase superfamily II)